MLRAWLTETRTAALDTLLLSSVRLLPPPNPSAPLGLFYPGLGQAFPASRTFSLEDPATAASPPGSFSGGLLSQGSLPLQPQQRRAPVLRPVSWGLPRHLYREDVLVVSASGEKAKVIRLLENRAQRTACSGVGLLLWLGREFASASVYGEGV